MKRIVLFISLSLLFGGTGRSADTAGSAIQRQVWGQYLGQEERQALAAMIPGTNSSDNDARKYDGMESIARSRSTFTTMATEYASSLAEFPSVSFTKEGIKGSWIIPEGAHPSRVLLYLHGGAYVIGSDETPRAITAFLARESKIRCFSLDYPLAPENPFPAALDNALQAYRMLLEEGTKPNEVVLAGDSAGGGLVLALLLGIRENALPMPAGAYLISPWADLTQSSATHSVKGAVDINVTHEFLEESATMYTNGNDRTNPLISPAFGNLRGLPPLLIQVGSHERLLDDSLTIARNAALADVPTRLTVWSGYPHVFQFYHRDLSGAQKALCEASGFIIETLNGNMSH